MKKAENVRSCLQRDSTECEGYAGAQSAVQPGSGETAGRSQNLLEAILYRDNLNRAYNRVKANKGAPGVDGMTVEEALPWLKKHGKEMTEAIRSGKYKPTAVRRKEIPKPDGGVRKLGIPTVKDRIVQQAIAQQLMPQYEAKFSEGSYGYRPGRSAQDAIFKIRGYADEGYEWAVQLDLSKYFDTLNYEKLLNLLRETIKDERVIQLIKKFLKSGVMENGVKIATTEGGLQGGPLSPLLANVYLNEFDCEYERRGVLEIRYADDIVLLCKSQRAAERLLESSIRYLEGKLKLRVNRDKSHIARVNATKKLQVSGLRIRQRKGWTVHSCPSQSPAESEEQAARNHEAKPRSQRPKGHAGNKGLHDRMAELLRDSVPKDENAGMGRMAAAPNPCIHLEAMEETEDQTQEPHEARCAGILRTYGRQQPQRILVYGERGSRDKRHNKRKTHTRGIL